MANCSEAKGTITMDRGFYENYKDEIENAWNGYSFYGISWDDVDFKENTAIINFYGTGRWSMASTLEWWFFNEWSPSFADVIQREKPVLMVDYTDMETNSFFYIHCELFHNFISIGGKPPILLYPIHRNLSTIKYFYFIY